MSTATDSMAKRPAPEAELLTYADAARLLQTSEKSVCRTPRPAG